MRLLAILLVIFTVVPAAELALLLAVGSQIGAWPTFLVIVLTGVVGASLARHQGTRAWLQVRQTMADGKLPTTEVADAFLILVAGIVLVTPGFMTDLIGFLLLVPVTRSLARRILVTALKKRADVFKIRWHVGGTQQASGGTEQAAADDIIDVEASVVDDESSEAGSSTLSDRSQEP